MNGKRVDLFSVVENIGCVSFEIKVHRRMILHFLCSVLIPQILPTVSPLSVLCPFVSLQRWLNFSASWKMLVAFPSKLKFIGEWFFIFCSVLIPKILPTVSPLSVLCPSVSLRRRSLRSLAALASSAPSPHWPPIGIRVIFNLCSCSSCACFSWFPKKS